MLDLSLVVVVFLAIGSTSLAQNICPPPFTLWEGECFFVYEDRSDVLGWVESRQRCLDMGGDLAQPKVLNFNSGLVKYIREFPIGTVPLWLGGSRIEANEKMKWLSGEPVNNSTWQEYDFPHQAFPDGSGQCMFISYNYNYDSRGGFYVAAWSCVKKAMFACEFVPGKISSLLRKSFTYSSIEVDWIRPYENKLYDPSYTLKWVDPRSQVEAKTAGTVPPYNITSSLEFQWIPSPDITPYYTSYTVIWRDILSDVEQEATVSAPPYNITGLNPCSNYIVTVIPHRDDNAEVANNSVAMATGVNGAVLGYNIIYFNFTELSKIPYTYIGYYNRMRLNTCLTECSRQEACTLFQFKDRGYGCVFSSTPVPAYSTTPSPEYNTLYYVKKGCQTL